MAFLAASCGFTFRMPAPSAATAVPKAILSYPCTEGSEPLVGRSEAIADYIGTWIDDILDECSEWVMPLGEEEPKWCEIRDAIMAKVFAVEHEMEVQKSHSEYVRENCL